MNLTPAPLPDDFKTWLASATRDLLDTDALQTRQELENHYLDACEEYTARGLSAREAHLLAMANLGDASIVAETLHQVHFSPRRAYSVLAVSLIYPLGLYSMQWLVFRLPYALVSLFVNLFTTLIVLYISHTLFRYLQSRKINLRRSVTLLTVSQILWTLAPILYYLLYQQMPLMNQSGSLYIDTTTLTKAILNYLMLAGESVSGAACLWMGLILFRQAAGLIKYAGMILTYIGGLSVAMCISILLNLEVIAVLFSSINYVLLTSLLCLLGYHFFKVVTQKQPTPLKTA